MHRRRAQTRIRFPEARHRTRVRTRHRVRRIRQATHTRSLAKSPPCARHTIRSVRAMKLFDPKNDVMFKALLTQSPELLIDVIERVLDLSIASLADLKTC